MGLFLLDRAGSGRIKGQSDLCPSAVHRWRCSFPTISWVQQVTRDRERRRRDRDNFLSSAASGRADPSPNEREMFFPLFRAHDTAIAWAFPKGAPLPPVENLRPIREGPSTPLSYHPPTPQWIFLFCSFLCYRSLPLGQAFPPLPSENNQLLLWPLLKRRKAEKGLESQVLLI